MVFGLGGSSSSDAADKNWGEKFRVYVFIELGIWLPICFATCYRYQPTMMFMRTATGKAIVERTGSVLLRVSPRFHASLATLAGKIEGAPIGRSLAEWALINKVLAPINFPLKFWLAHKWVEYRKSLANTELPEMPAIPTPVRASE